MTESSPYPVSAAVCTYIRNITKTIVNLLITIGPFGVIAFGRWLVTQDRLELGVLLAFISGLERLAGPIHHLIAEYSQITEAQMRYPILLDTFPEHPNKSA